ncbi:MAG: hypothetical protein KatS3mg131_2351 [Candidatus Tectimicrobiota bacterium]|nr:MAG: hypothetical protein KatS3mg131_2351 [Candidatus Tectomicrobia bacterium]
MVTRLWICGVISLLLATVAVAQTPAAETAPYAALEADEPASLTAAQEEARRLAAALLEEQPPPTPVLKVPLAIITERPLRPGERLVIVLFRTRHLEGRLLGGVQTLASPTDLLAVVVLDARRPTFLPAEQAAVAVEMAVR